MDAEDAKAEIQGKNFGGLKLNIEWSKKSGRFDSSEALRRKDKDNRYVIFPHQALVYLSEEKSKSMNLPPFFAG